MDKTDDNRSMSASQEEETAATAEAAAAAAAACSSPPVLYGWKGFTGDLGIQIYPCLSPYKIRSIAPGGGHVLFLTESGKVFGRGHNAHGQLGLGEELMGHAQSEPLLISALADEEIVAVAGGRSHSTAVTVDGDVYCWGDSSDGQCGTGSLDTVNTPTKVKIVIQEGFCEHGMPRPDTRVAIDSVSCGATHTLALSSQEEVWAWGCGGQLGMEDLLHSPLPRRVELLIGRRVLMVACGESHSLALLKKADRSPKAEASPARSKEVSKDHVVTQKHYPSMCAKCKKEIYTYTDTNDTCIIENEHECQADDSNLSFDSNMCLSGEGLPASQLASTKTSGPANTSLTRQSPDKDSEDSALGTENVDSSADEQSENVTGSNNEKRLPSAESDSAAQSQSSSGPASVQDCSPGEKERGCEKQEESESQTSDGNITANPEKAASDSTKVRPDTPSQEAACDVVSKQVEQSSEETACKPSVEASVSVESDGEVWKRQSESDIQTPVVHEEKVTSLDRSMSLDCFRSRTPSASSTASLHKLKNFVDESQARDYLARQFEDEKNEEVQDSSPKKEATESSWKSFLPYSSSMMETVKTMTSKAITNFQSTMDSLVGQQQNMELGDMSVAGAAASEQTSTTSATLSTSVMSDSSSSLEFGLDLPEGKRLSVDRDRCSQSPPSLSHSSHLSESPPETGRQSLRTLEMKQQNIQRRISAGFPKESVSDAEPAPNEIIIDTEVWAWGNNEKGQLGLGDTVNRNKPVCIKLLNGRCILKIAAGSNHSLALTSNSQVYAWGANSYGQLGHSETGISPSRIKFMKGCCVWDLAGGTNHSVYLADSSGMKPDVFYCGKQPGKDAFSSMQKAALPTPVNEIKKLGWIRGLSAGGDSCFCTLGTSQLSAVSAVYELAASERAFYQELVRINANLLKPLTRSSFFTVMDVFPYKSCLHNLVAGFISLTKKVGQGACELTDVVRQDQPIMSAALLRCYSYFIKEFRRYSRFFADFLAVGGFEYCARVGSEFFDKNQGRDSPARPGEDRQDGRGDRPQVRFRRNMQYPFLRLKEYSRLLQKMVDSFEGNSDASNLLQKAVVSWDTLKLTVTAEHKAADTTRVFWEGANPRLADALRIPSRRVLRDSKTRPLFMPAAGRFSSYLFILFNDMFVHLQSNSHTIFPLETLWVETPVTDPDQLPMIVVISPEDRLELSVSSAAEKAEWLMAFNSAINKVLSSQKEVGRRGSAERLAPPLARHANHSFSRHPRWKDGTYAGTWLSGKMHGQGEIKWPDGRKYTGTFKHGLQQGQGVLVIPKAGSSKEVQDGNWKDGLLNGIAHIRYANGDDYKGFFQMGTRFGHGVLQQGRHLSSYASIYVGEWLNDKRNGYGVQDDVLKGEKYMGMWVEDHRHGNGIMVTLDGMYFEGNFYMDKLTGFGLMLTDDNSCYEGEFMDITQLYGKGTLTLPTGDQLDGNFSGSWNEGLKISGTFIKSNYSTPERQVHTSPSVKSKYYSQLSVPADKKWEDIFHHCCSSLGHDASVHSVNTKKAWDMVAVAVSNGKKQIKELQKTSAAKAKLQAAGLEELETIPPNDASVSLTVESYAAISKYLRKAFDTTFHPLGQLMENLIDVFRAAYIGVGAHPRLLHHAVQEVNSCVRRMYAVLRILFPQLPADGGPLRVFPNDHKHPPLPTTQEHMQAFLEQQQEQEAIGEIVTAAGLLYPILLPKIYPPLFDLYALYNDRSDDRYWERVSKLNRQGDMALMAFLGIDQKYWLMDSILLEDKSQKLSSTRDVCYASAVDALQQLSTAFSPMDKLLVIEATFNEITQTVQGVLGDDHMWCMDDLFPIFQFVVVRAKIRHLGAEISMIDDLMERHMEHGELGIMFTTLKASFFQIQNEKMPHH